MALPPEPPQHTRRPGSGKSGKPDLKFAPLSDGLGFHPFSDGLPYAPVSKAPSSSNMGTGAVAAGHPTFVTSAPAPRMQAPRISAAQYVPQVPKAQITRTVPLPMAQVSQIAKTTQTAPSKLTPESIAASLSPELLQPQPGFVYVLKRVFAYLIDSACNLGLCAGALSFALWKQDLSPELLVNPGIVLIAGLFLGFFNWAITTAEEVAFGTSVGKRLFGLALNGSAAAIFLRAFFFLPSLCFGGIGLVWALFDRRRRCWHDLVVDIQPIEIASL